MARTRPQSAGVCVSCGACVAKAQMARHLKTCLNRMPIAELPAGLTKRQARYFHIMAEGQEFPDYWLHLDVRSSTRLLSLDNFLRDIWLECCGHLSKLTIGGVEYVSYDPREDPFPGEEDLRRMTAKVDAVLRPGMTFTHEYDFGTTTYLTLTVLAERIGIYRRDPVHLLARNDPPDRPCAICGKPATHVCTMCIYTDTPAWYCDDENCQQQHTCDDPSGPYWLPVTNSPRVGQCGYTGWVDWGDDEQ
jgi:hypothetical protein